MVVVARAGGDARPSHGGPRSRNRNRALQSYNSLQNFGTEPDVFRERPLKPPRRDAEVRRQLAHRRRAGCRPHHPNAGFGDCGINNLVVRGPKLVRFDLSAVKRTQITGRVNFEFRAEMLNAFNTPWFSAVADASNDPDDYRVTSTVGGSNRTMQVVWRLNW